MPAQPCSVLWDSPGDMVPCSRRRESCAAGNDVGLLCGGDEGWCCPFRYFSLVGAGRAQISGDRLPVSSREVQIA